MTPEIMFCGAARTVTGSCFLIRHAGGVFLVDCGMFQGSKTLKALNYDPFPFEPAEVDFVLLTHAHIDHSGLAPRLIKEGFAGPIHATEGTRDLLSFMWPDSGHIHESEVRTLNRRQEQRGKPTVEPIYTAADGDAAIARLAVVGYDDWFTPGAGVRVRYWNAGHILGSASIEIEVDDPAGDRPIRILFSGDLGPEHKQFHPDPEGPGGIDFLVCESTYGDRARKELAPAARRAALRSEVNRALRGGEGVLVIPAFSVERTQELLADLASLLDDGGVGDPLVFLDSPLAIRATGAFAKHAPALEDIGGADIFSHENFVFTASADESKRINSYANNVIIIAASGMCEAGRIRHHLKRRLWRRETTVLMVGYQAEGTLGSLLLNGKKSVRIQGDAVRVEAQIRDFDAYSGHADVDGLVDWVKDRMPIGCGVFLTHGESKAIDALKRRLQGEGLDADRIHAPAMDQTFVLRRSGMSMKEPDRPRLPDETLIGFDWHNDLAQLSLDIRDAIEGAADERSRQVVIRRLRRALQEGENEAAR